RNHVVIRAAAVREWKQLDLQPVARKRRLDVVAAQIVLRAVVIPVVALMRVKQIFENVLVAGNAHLPRDLRADRRRPRHQSPKQRNSREPDDAARWNSSNRHLRSLRLYYATSLIWLRIVNDESDRRASVCLVSVFVKPTQFPCRSLTLDS